MERFLEETLGEALPRFGEEQRFRVLAAGRFSGRIAGDLFTYARNQEIDAALIMVERDVTRILFFSNGIVIGADSNVLFDRLGRVLGNAGILEKEDARELSDIEETSGVAAAAARISPDAAQWGLERRVWEIAAGLYYMPRAHYILVDGEPDLGALPRFCIPPMDLAVEGLRRYDEWRNRSTTRKGEPEPEEAPNVSEAKPDVEPEEIEESQESEEIEAALHEAAGRGGRSAPSPSKRSGAAPLPVDAGDLRKQISDLLKKG